MAYSYICSAAAIYICIFNSIFALFPITHQNIPRMCIYCTYGIRWGIWTIRCWHLEYSGGTSQYSACLTRSHRQWRYWQWWVNPKSVTFQCRRILTNANIMARRGIKNVTSQELCGNYFFFDRIGSFECINHTWITTYWLLIYCQGTKDVSCVFPGTVLVTHTDDDDCCIYSIYTLILTASCPV